VNHRRDPRFEILLTFEEYAVTTSPIPDPVYDRLPPTVRAEAEAIHDELVDSGTVAISRVEELVRRHPRVPTFRNHLFQAQLAAGEQDAAEATIQRCVEEHPDYLFGLCGLAKLHLARSEPWTWLIHGLVPPDGRFRPSGGSTRHRRPARVACGSLTRWRNEIASPDRLQPRSRGTWAAGSNRSRE
jgi:hypothetical protein